MQATITNSDAEPVPFWSALIRDRRMAPALGLGFTSGMPFLLTYSTQSAWLTDAGVPLATISAALDRRMLSQDPDPFSNKLLSMMRHQFGGHAAAAAKSK